MSSEKTPEQVKQERLERYQKDPNTFIELSDIVLCALRNDKSALGISVFVGNCKRSELNNAQAEIDHVASKQRMNLDISAEMKRQAANNLVKPAATHGIMDFVKGRRN